MAYKWWSALKKTTKKELLVQVSILLAVFLIATILNDLVAYTITQNTHRSTQNLSESVLVRKSHRCSSPVVRRLFSS